jgi:hypothetical protein
MDRQFLTDIEKIIIQLNEHTAQMVSYYKPIAANIIYGRNNDEHDIETVLDGILECCSNDEMLRLYKRVLRSIIYKFPETVEFYVRAYYEIWEPEKLDFTYDNIDGGE